LAAAVKHDENALGIGERHDAHVYQLGPARHSSRAASSSPRAAAVTAV
jgi:hypothetical protein